MLPRPRLSWIGWSIAIVFFILSIELILSSVEEALGGKENLLGRQHLASLTKQVEAAGFQRLSNLEDGWNLVCLATPYCGGTIDGAPAELTQACRTTYADSQYALAYFQGEKLLHVETLALDGKITKLASSKPCLSLAEDPVIIMHGTELQIAPGSEL